MESCSVSYSIPNAPHHLPKTGPSATKNLSSEVIQLTFEHERFVESVLVDVHSERVDLLKMSGIAFEGWMRLKCSSQLALLLSPSLMPPSL